MKNNLISTHVNGYFAGNYSSIEALPANKTVCEIFYDGSFQTPFFNGTEWIEGATAEEIAQVAYQTEIESAKSFMEQKENDGCSFYKEMDLKMTIALSKIEIAVLFEILNEVDNVLYPPLMKIKTGDFASALFIFSNQQPPINNFVLDFYNEAVSYCQNYYNTKYPK